MIDSYQFGQIVINGQIYRSDVIIFPGSVKDHWWRESGHSLSKSDIAEIVEFKPEIILIGCGASGMLKVPTYTKEYVESLGIQLIDENTGKACETYNKIQKEKKVVVGLHLTC